MAQRGKKSKATYFTAADSLPWASTTLPDRLDDAEGFFGLEEVSDVEVVKDEDAGRVSFKTYGEVDGATTEAESEEEWTGLESPSTDVDDLPNKQPLHSEQIKELQRNSKLEKTTKDRMSVTNELGKYPRTNQSHNEFAALQDEEGREVDVSAWRPLEISPTIRTSLSKLGFASPTPIQKAAIPEIIASHDVVGKAATGSGKTIAFGIPIIEHILSHQAPGYPQNQDRYETSGKTPCALIISPTRELAHQLSRHLAELCSGITAGEPSVVTITGGLSLLKQRRLLSDADIIVGTPGRLWEIFSQTPGMTESLKHLRFLVLDEADRLLSEGHFEEVQELLAYLEKGINTFQAHEDVAEDDKETRKPWQTLVFSATFQKDLQQKLVKRMRFSYNSNVLNDRDSMEYLFQKLNFREQHPRFIDVDPTSQMAANLTESILECGSMEKDLYLYSLLLQPQHQASRILIFTNSISSVRRLTTFLHNLNLPAFPLHSQMPQKSRLRSLERFSSISTSSKPSKPCGPTTQQQPTRSILVATDVAARGLDIPVVNIILHYHVPRAADTYVHRSGRTARAGLSGSSTLLCSPEEVQPVQRLIARVHNNQKRHKFANKDNFRLETLTLSPDLLKRVKPRVTLSQKLTACSMAKEKERSSSSFFKEAAEELGVEYNSDDEEAEAKGRGRGKGRKKREKTAREVPKEEIAGMKKRLKDELAKRIVVGGSARYLTAGGWDLEELMAEVGSGG